MSAPAPDPLARTGALAIAAGRLGLGVAICAFTGRALQGLGFEADDPSAVTLARLAGGRDVALGLHGLAARHDPARLAHSSAIATAVDAGDGVAFLAAWLGRDGIPNRAAALNLPLIAAAVTSGAVVTARLRGS